MRNSDPWFDFLSREFPEGRGPGGLAVEEIGPGHLRVRLWKGVGPIGSVFEAMAGVLDDTTVSDRLRSAEPTGALSNLDAQLGGLRAEHPALPLLVHWQPDRYLPRSHAWMLGEYLAERDLPLWADLYPLHPSRAVDWTRNLVETGLASPRLLVRLPPGVILEDVAFIGNSGTWGLAVRSGGGGEGYDLEQC